MKCSRKTRKVDACHLFCFRWSVQSIVTRQFSLPFFLFASPPYPPNVTNTPTNLTHFYPDPYVLSRYLRATSQSFRRNQIHHRFSITLNLSQN